MAKVVRFHEIGGPEVLRIENVEIPPPAKGEVQIRVHALGLNRAEVMFRAGQYVSQPRFPARPGYEAAGTVAAIGAGVTGFKIGDAVSVVPGFDLNDYGFYGDLANAPANLVAHHPPGLSWVQAAAVWMQYMTAYGALIDIAGLRSGDTVVIPAASSSVGLAAIQIANRVGAIPIALTRGRSKRKALIDAGAAHVIVTDEQDLVGEILAITRGKGAKVVFDPVGGATVVKLTQAMARFGILFIYGALSPEPTPLPLLNVLVNGLTIRGYSLMEVTTDPARLERGKRFINEGLADGRFKPIIARTFPLEQIIAAHQYLESNQQFGKIVVTVVMPMSPTADAYVRSINDQNRAAFNALFVQSAVVNDVGREFRGLAAIKAWSDREIFDAKVTLEVIDVAERDGETIVTTKVDGNFDRTGLPDPVVINHHITAEDGKIVALSCRLAQKL